jgi:hypothetical protein
MIAYSLAPQNTIDPDYQWRDIRIVRVRDYIRRNRETARRVAAADGKEANPKTILAIRPDMLHRPRW